MFVSRIIRTCGWKITEVVCGGAKGVDSLGKQWAEEHQVPVTMFPANWEKYGKSAGPKRNQEMAEYAEALIAVWDGKSRGTKSMIDLAVERDLPVVMCLVGAVAD